MKKTGKRILALIVLILVVILVGCLLFTGNRLNDYPDTMQAYERSVFKAKDGSMVAFTDEQVWYGAGEGEVILLEVIGYSEGRIVLQKGDKAYTFMAIDENVIYDIEREVFLERR